MNKKRQIFIIDRPYAMKYHLDDSFIGKRICIYTERYTHIEKHRNQFSDEYELTKIIDNLPKIVACPDYIHINNKKRGMEIVKKLNDNVLIAVRISRSNELKIKSLYPITEAKYYRLKEDIKIIKKGWAV